MLLRLWIVWYYCQMNTNQKTSHLRTNLVIAVGVAIILISLAWLGYRFTMQVKANQAFEQTIQDDSPDKAEPSSGITAGAQQDDASSQDATLPDN